MSVTTEDLLHALDELVYAAKHSSDDTLRNSVELWNAEALLVCAEIDTVVASTSDEGSER